MQSLRALVQYHLAAMSTDGYAVDFGDSHAQRGWDDTSTLQAALAARIVRGVPLNANPPAIDGCELRAFSASLYGSGGTYDDPWRLPPELLELNASGRVQRCTPDTAPTTVSVTRPLGGARVNLFPEGGYASLRLPLLPANDSSSPPCFGLGSQRRCVDGSAPSLFDNVPYAYLALQARPNTFSHSEVDFGTFIWSAWGSRLLSDFGYGTIATAVGDWDTRRYQYIDNNPAGHNTVVVTEAFASPASDVNFAQMNKGEPGVIRHANVSRGTADRRGADSDIGCIELDGSAVYGAGNAGGWLDTMRRFACPLETGGAIALIDVLGVKRGREPLSIYGATCGVGGVRTEGRCSVEAPAAPAAPTACACVH